MEKAKDKARQELLPCPFCSSPAEEGTVGFQAYIQCTNPDCHARLYTKMCGGSIEELYRAWNSRGSARAISQGQAAAKKAAAGELPGQTDISKFIAAVK